tara:strand:+ start:11075 stop:11689 length:615 start_codon:yes stop_codon:yes gene_type:complete
MRKTDPTKVQEQRDRIIQGALKCFARKGVHGTSTDDICRAAKVSSGALYYYFKSRDGLIHDVIVHAHQARDHLLLGLIDTPDMLKALTSIQVASAQVIAAQGVPVEVYLELLAYSTRNAKAGVAFREAAERVLDILEQAVRANQIAGKLRADIDPERLARFITAAVTGMSVAEILQGSGSHEDFAITLALILGGDGKTDGKAED